MYTPTRLSGEHRYRWLTLKSPPEYSELRMDAYLGLTQVGQSRLSTGFERANQYLSFSSGCFKRRLSIHGWIYSHELEPTITDTPAPLLEEVGAAAESTKKKVAMTAINDGI